MFTKDLIKRILWEPYNDTEADQLFILSGYATPNMASWYIKNTGGLCVKRNLQLSLIVGMVQYDGLSVSIHEGFKY